MAYPGAKIRLFVDVGLAGGVVLDLAAAQAHYLGRVMRAGTGDGVAVFNGRDGEWRARIEISSRTRCAVRVIERTRPQAAEPDLWLAFAPIKRAPVDFLARKATELGVSRLWPVFTQRTASGRVNTDRLRANTVEAAEQCRRLTVPEVSEPVPLDRLIALWPPQRRLLVADETGGGRPIAKALGALGMDGPRAPFGLLVGPEGGFARSELDALHKLDFVTAVHLGPRILRADTVALAALACWQALIGDWGDRPRPAGS